MVRDGEWMGLVVIGGIRGWVMGEGLQRRLVGFWVQIKGRIRGIGMGIQNEDEGGAGIEVFDQD